MKSKFLFLLALNLVASSFVLGQPVRRWVVMSARGPVARQNDVNAALEDAVTDGLTGKLAGLPGMALIDRSSLDKVLREQNFQNSDRSAAGTAVRIGKLLGAGQIVLLQLTGAAYSQHNEQSVGSIRAIGTVQLGAMARVIDIETAVILAQPSSSFQDSVVVSETKRFPVRKPATQGSGSDAKVIVGNEFGKAVDTVVKELADKLTTTVPAAGTTKLETALVAGIVSGAVYINRGSAAGIKAGDKFQIMREASVGLTDPETGKPMVQKQRVCVLTIVNADETNASGTCQGGLPQTKDVAEPLK